MFAHQVLELAGPDALDWREVDEPARDEYVLVDVVAAGVSFADLLLTRGEYQVKPQLPFSPGMDAAGVVRWAPAGADVEEGERVAVLLRYGCWQEVVAAPAARVVPLPDDLGFESGAALSLNYLTALHALASRARAEPGETLVVHGAAGGVGTAAVQIGRALGLRTIAVAGDEPKRQFTLECGAHEAVLADGWLAAVQSHVGERAVDIVVDPVGGDRVLDSLRSLAPDGRLVVLGFTAGEIPTVRVNRLLLANTGVLGAAALEYFERRPAAIREFWTDLMALRRDGVLPAPPLQQFPFTDARRALSAIADREAKGKVVLTKHMDVPRRATTTDD
jgi:NADPH2:quinone reductase